MAAGTTGFRVENSISKGISLNNAKHIYVFIKNKIPVLFEQALFIYIILIEDSTNVIFFSLKKIYIYNYKY